MNIEHVEDSKKRHELSHMATHMQQAHPEEWMNDQERCWKNYKVEIMKVHRSSFIRQLHEAVAIMLQPGITLNVDAEYNRCIVPSLEVKGAKKEGIQQQLEREIKEAAERLRADEIEAHTEETAAKRNRQDTEPIHRRKRPRVEAPHEEHIYTQVESSDTNNEDTHTQEAPAAVGALQQLQALPTPDTPDKHEKTAPGTLGCKIRREYTQHRKNATPQEHQGRKGEQPQRHQGCRTPIHLRGRGTMNHQSKE